MASLDYCTYYLQLYYCGVRVVRALSSETSNSSPIPHPVLSEHPLSDFRVPVTHSRVSYSPLPEPRYCGGVANLGTINTVSTHTCSVKTFSRGTNH
jgi:hypothetical protein